VAHVSPEQKALQNEVKATGRLAPCWPVTRIWQTTPLIFRRRGRERNVCGVFCFPKRKQTPRTAG